LKKFDVPTLIIHGDDEIVPIGAAALLSSKLVKNAALKGRRRPEGGAGNLAGLHQGVNPFSTGGDFYGASAE
jgi:hypothetical protein